MDMHLGKNGELVRKIEITALLLLSQKTSQKYGLRLGQFLNMHLQTP